MINSHHALYSHVLEITRAKPQEAGRYRFIIVGLTAFLAFAFGLNLFAVGPITPIMIEHFDVNNSRAGLLTSIVFFVHIVLAIPASLLVGRMGLKSIITLGAIVASTTLLSFSATNSFTLLLLLRGISGVGFLLVFPAVGPLFMQWVRPRELPLANGIFVTAASAGITVSSFLVAPLSEAIGWEIVLSSLGGLSMISTVTWVLLGRANEFIVDDPIRSQIRNVWKVIWSRNAILIAIADAGPLALLSVALGWLPAFYYEAHGISLVRGGVLMGLLSLSGLVSLVAATFLTTKIHSRRPFLVIPGALIGLAGLSVVFLAGSGAIYFAVIVLGLACWIYVPALVTIPMDLYSNKPRTVSYIFAALLGFGGIASFAAPPIVGALADYTGSYIPGLVIFAVLASSLGIAGLMLPESGRSKSAI
ncbi:MFS transporter [SAR202 cluster bacterium AD-804-J14_MRT_500m]|nr:MFS transporter [SAR202 cluster bacterium AD-804-J14_MRT_500m]